MSEALRKALNDMILGTGDETDPKEDQRYAIHMDLLWKLIRKDYHGVADCAMDLRELHL